MTGPSGFTQWPRVDFSETFSPGVKLATVRTVWSALLQQWPIHQLNVKNAFLQSSGFKDPVRPGFVCRLRRSLYGLKQAPRAWNSRFAAHLLNIWFVEAKSDASLFIYHRYVDNIVLTASLSSFLRRVIEALQLDFSMIWGLFITFLGCMFDRTFLIGLVGLIVNLALILLTLSPSFLQTPNDFRSLDSALQYLTFTSCCAADLSSHA